MRAWREREARCDHRCHRRRGECNNADSLLEASSSPVARRCAPLHRRLRAGRRSSRTSSPLTFSGRAVPDGTTCVVLPAGGADCAGAASVSTTTAAGVISGTITVAVTIVVVGRHGRRPPSRRRPPAQDKCAPMPSQQAEQAASSVSSPGLRQESRHPVGPRAAAAHVRRHRPSSETPPSSRRARG